MLVRSQSEGKGLLREETGLWVFQHSSYGLFAAHIFPSPDLSTHDHCPPQDHFKHNSCNAVQLPELEMTPHQKQIPTEYCCSHALPMH